MTIGLIIFSSLALTPHPAFAVDCTFDKLLCPTSDGYKYYFDGTTFYKVGADLPHTAPDSSGPGISYEFGFSPDCPANQGPTDDRMCGAAANACAAAGQTGIRMIEWYRETAPLPGTWTRGTTLCSGPGTVVTLAQLRDGITSQIEDIITHLPPQEPRVQPENTVLVNLPAIVVAPAPPNPDFAVTLPLPGLVHITPTYHWDFGDGATLDSDRVGIPFDVEHDPRQTSDYYLSHTYTHAQADAAVTLTVTWHATFTITGSAPISVAAVVLPPLRKVVQVREARGVLVTH